MASRPLSRRMPPDNGCMEHLLIITDIYINYCVSCEILMMAICAAPSKTEFHDCSLCVCGSCLPRMICA